MQLPARYAYLGLHGALPRVVSVALKYYGVAETKGSKHNPVIINWAKETGLKKEYTADEIPWCGLFMAKVMLEAGKPAQAGPLWARNWAKYGTRVEQPRLGDVLVFTRPGGGGHVGLYIGETATRYCTLGGNTGDKVSVADLEKSRLIAARAVPFTSRMPDSYRPYVITSKGVVSTNEE